MSRASREVASPRVVNVEDLRLLAKRRLPKAIFDYLDGGAEDEITLRENCRVFCDYTFRPRHAVKFPEYNLRTTVLGGEISFPAFLAPVGYSRGCIRAEKLLRRQRPVTLGVATHCLQFPGTNWKTCERQRRVRPGINFI
jgi:hypothetical protein